MKTKTAESDDDEGDEEQKMEDDEIPKQQGQSCATPDCVKPAAMQCPTCIKLSLPATYFCGQECFAGFWKFHKMVHKKPEITEVAGHFTGPLRPFPYSFRGLREIPDNIHKPDYATTGAPNQHF